MKYTPLLLLTPLLMAQDASGCDPTALEAAGVRPDDGGVWIGSPDANIFLVTTTQPLGPDDPPPPLPPLETLCMLYPGDILQRSDDYESSFGTWIHDVQDVRFLGRPAPDAKYAGPESANLRYTYRKPGTTDKQVSLTMTFEKLPVVQREGALQDNGARLRLPDGTTYPAAALATNGYPLPEPYFLTRVDAQGLDEQPLCWDPFLRHSTAYHWLECDWCGQIGRDFLLCFGDARGCFF